MFFGGEEVTYILVIPSHWFLPNCSVSLTICLIHLFQVFGNAPPSTMTEKFSDLLQFTTQVSRLMVTEIRRRASNKSTGEPSDVWTFYFREVKKGSLFSRLP